jgi:hypothetical protein
LRRGWLYGNLFGAGIPLLVLALWSASSSATAFYFVNSMAQVARRSDPFERDNLHWSKVRYVLAAGLVAAVAITLVGSPVNLVFGQGVGTATSTPVVYQILGFGQYIAVFVVGSAVSLVSAVRSKDRTIQRHLRWFGLFLIAILAGLGQLSILSRLAPSAFGEVGVSILRPPSVWRLLPVQKREEPRADHDAARAPADRALKQTTAGGDDALRERLSLKEGTLAHVGGLSFVDLADLRGEGHYLIEVRGQQREQSNEVVEGLSVHFPEVDLLRVHFLPVLRDLHGDHNFIRAILGSQVRASSTASGF